MPQLKDAPVIVSGQVIDNATLTDRQSGDYVGRKVTLMVVDPHGDPGFAVVKFSDEEGRVHNPNHFDQVNWVVRSAPYDIKDGPSGMSTRFIREVNAGDVDRLLSAVSAPATK